MIEVIWTLGAALALVLMVSALVSIARASRGLTNMGSLVWALLVLFLPIVGAIWWFASGRRAALRAAGDKKRTRQA